MLLELGADPNVGTNDEAKARGDTGSTLGFTPLHVAARSGQADMAELLLSRPDTDADKRDADGNNASYWAQHAASRSRSAKQRVQSKLSSALQRNGRSVPPLSSA